VGTISHQGEEKMEDRIEWLEGRRKGIGGSDVAGICGLSKWNTPRTIWEQKTNKVPVTDEMTPVQYWGTIMEPVIVQQFEKKTGLFVTTGCDQIADSKQGYMVANVDGIVQTEGAIFEAKTCSAFAASEWGDEDTEEIPTQYFLQVQHYMAVLNMNKTYVAVLIGGNDFRVYTINRDDKVIDMIRDRCRTFWCDFVETDTEPPLTVDERIESACNVNKGSFVTSDIRVNNEVLKLRGLKEQEKSLKADIKQSETVIKDYMGANENLVTAEGSTIATWKQSVSNRFDSKLFKKDNPETYSTYCNESVSRRFLIK
jgi:putative phage-type endonuclease